MGSIINEEIGTSPLSHLHYREDYNHNSLSNQNQFSHYVQNDTLSQATCLNTS